MKVGRNDPCPCGSGKKYKKCCLAKDEATTRQVAQERATAIRAIEPLSGGEPLAGFPAYTPPPPPEPRLRSPEEAAREELWEAFQDADAAEQSALFQHALADGLLDDEYAFEMLAHLRDEGDRARWGTLVEDRPWEHVADSENERINRLGFRFQGELVRHWGMPLGRAELGRVALIDYVIERRNPDSSIAQAVQRPKGKQKSAALTASELLCPDRESLDRYVAQKLNFLSSQLIEAAVTLETVPAWLRFLHDQGLITAERRTEALRDLSKLVQQAEPIWAQYPSDPALGPNILAAWERAAEA